MRHTIIKIITSLCLALPILLYAPNLDAKILLQCGAISGHAYYLPTNGQNGEWIKDRAKLSGFSLSIEGEKADILWKDRTGIRSATSDGGTVYVQGFKGDVLTLSVNYKSHFLTELWTFNIGKKEMYYSSHRLGGLAPKVALYKATCK